jgi:hypothetical protein
VLNPLPEPEIESTAAEPSNDLPFVLATIEFLKALKGLSTAQQAELDGIRQQVCERYRARS